MRRFIALIWLMAALAPRSIAAQAQQPLGETAADYRVHVGPIGLGPTLVVENLGIDTNASLSHENPVRDVTFRLTPGTSYLLPIQRARLYGTSTISYQYYDKTASQRSFDILNDAAFSYVGSRFTPRVFGNYGRQRTRPNLEIEATVRQLNQGFGFGTDVRFSPRFVIQVDAKRTRQEFEDRIFRGASLSKQLDRTSDLVRTTARIGLTPITSLVVTGSNLRERFRRSPDRDAETVMVLAGFEMKPSALISGNASVGYRRFNALSENIPDFRGVVADIALNYTLLDRTRFEIGGHRGVEFSAETLDPYYVVTSGSLTITQMIGRGWDVRVGGGGDGLAYRTLIDRLTTVTGQRTDHIESVNMGFGYRVGDSGRIGLEIVHVTRRSPVDTYSYEGWRAGVKVTYGT